MPYALLGASAGVLLLLALVVLWVKRGAAVAVTDAGRMDATRRTDQATASQPTRATAATGPESPTRVTRTGAETSKTAK
jgi:hypothetical protein